jgi:predicted  nucleic acid-binding Zn-ribbon protein
VALAAIQGLNEKLEEKEDEIRALRESNLAMERRLAALEELLQRMPAASNPSTQRTTKP